MESLEGGVGDRINGRKGDALKKGGMADGINERRDG